MPNHCYQSVFIHGPQMMVQELYWALELKEPRFCDVVLPIPFEQSIGMTGYDWRCANWGTKWDVIEVEIDDDGLEHSDDTYPNGPVAWFTFKCWTAWAPPIPVWDKLHSLGIEVQADYEDEGLHFAGEYANGEDKSWEPTALDDERWEPEEDMNLDKDVYEEEA